MPGQGTGLGSAGASWTPGRAPLAARRGSGESSPRAGLRPTRTLGPAPPRASGMAPPGWAQGCGTPRPASESSLCGRRRKVPRRPARDLSSPPRPPEASSPFPPFFFFFFLTNQTNCDKTLVISGKTIKSLRLQLRGNVLSGGKRAVMGRPAPPAWSISHYGSMHISFKHLANSPRTSKL